MNPFATAAAALHRATSTVNGGTVTYTQASSSVNVTATFGRSQLVTDDGTGAGIQVESDDFIVRTDELPFIPRHGDKITKPSTASTWTHGVMNPPYKPSDTSTVLFRIYTKAL